MAAIAAIATVVIVHMAGVAGGLMILVETKESLMVECRWRPALPGMALPAIAQDLPVQTVPGASVTSAALVTQFDLQEVVRELADRVESLNSFVVAVADDTVPFDQILVKGNEFLLVSDWQALGGEEADLRGFVALDALRRSAPDKGGVAGEAIGLQRLMRVHECARFHHEARIEHRKQQEQEQIRRNDREDGFLVHCHCQKRKMLRMCARPRTPKANVIGKCTARHRFIRSTVTASQKIAFSAASPVRPRCA